MPLRRSDARPLRPAGDSAARGRILGGAAIGGVLTLWAVIGATGWVTPFYLPPLPDVLAVAARMLADGTLVRHALVSLGRVLAGFALAVAVALPVGMAMGLSSRAHHVLEPWIELVRPIPPIAWIPMAILWLGIEEASKVFIIAYGAFFPIMLNSMAGFRDLDPLHLRAARILGATRLQIFWHVVVRSASRRIVTGLRLGVGMAFVVLVAAELIAAKAGLGFLIQDARFNVQTDHIMVGMAAIGLLGFGLNATLRALERGLIRWRP
jgi:ABC-type nitrate/sulfonate/bicarbonate transport system permease component